MSYQRKQKKNFDQVQVTNLDDLDDEFEELSPVKIVTNGRPGSKDTIESSSSSSSEDRKIVRGAIPTKHEGISSSKSNSLSIFETDKSDKVILKNQNANRQTKNEKSGVTKPTQGAGQAPRGVTGPLGNYRALNPVSSIQIKKRYTKTPDKNKPGRGHAVEDLVIQSLEDDFD